MVFSTEFIILQETLLNRIHSSNLSLPSLQLYQTLLQLDDQRIIDALLQQPTPIHASIKYHTPVKSKQKAQETEEMKREDFFDKYEDSPRPQRSTPTPGRIELNFESYLTQAQVNSAAKIAEFGSPVQGSNPVVRDSKGVGLIRELLNRFESFLDLRFDECVSLSGILNELILLPHDRFHVDFLSMLCGVLDELWCECKKRIKCIGIDKFNGMKTKREECLFNNNGDDVDVDNCFVNSYLVLVEFIQEIASVGEIRMKLSLLREDLLIN